MPETENASVASTSRPGTSSLSGRNFDAQVYDQNSELSNTESKAPYTSNRLESDQNTENLHDRNLPLPKQSNRWWNLGIKNTVGRWLRPIPTEGVQRFEWVCVSFLVSPQSFA